MGTRLCPLRSALLAVAAAVVLAGCASPSGGGTPGAAIAASMVATREATPAGTAIASTPISAAAEPTSTLPPGVPAGAEPASVDRVIDGDTIDVVLHGAVARVRFILVNTPEIHGTVECYGQAAADYVDRLLPPGTPVYLERDVSETDIYRRLLRYVYLADGSMLNERLVRDGYAQLATYPPDVKYRERIAAAAAAARADGVGLWTACATPTPTAAAAATAGSGPSNGACDPSYPDVCIPPPPPDLDCGDIPFRNFRVVGADPHRFDADHNGVGCESGG